MGKAYNLTVPKVYEFIIVEQKGRVAEDFKLATGTWMHDGADVTVASKLQ